MIPPIGTIGSLGAQVIPGVGTVGTSPSVAPTAAPATAGGEATTSAATNAAGEGGGFGEALTSAISSLDQTQQSASRAAQALSTGTASSPEGAIVAIDEAQLAMQLAGQIRTKATEATQQIFQTQV